MSGHSKLNLPSCQLRIKSDSGRDLVWDELRGCWLVLTPEEWVRRHLISYLNVSLGAPSARISQEYPVVLGPLNQRADVVVFDAQARPLLLAECKAPGVKIDQAVLAQAIRYNSVVGARYVMISNGLKHFIYERLAQDEYVPLKSLPDLPGLE